MSPFWKIALPLLLVLPIAAYVAGTFAVVDNGSGPRETIVIQDSGERDTSDHDRRPGGTKDGDDGEEIRREGDDDSDDDVDVVEPEPDDVTSGQTRTRNGGDDRDDGDDGEDDASGPGDGDDD